MSFFLSITGSEGRYVTYGFYERRDVESAIEWLVREKKSDRNRVGLAGESMGAAIALQVAAHNPWIRAVWADSPFASLRRVTEEFVRRVTRLPDVVLNPVTIFVPSSFGWMPSLWFSESIPATPSGKNGITGTLYSREKRGKQFVDRLAILGASSNLVRVTQESHVSPRTRRKVK